MEKKRHDVCNRAKCGISNYDSLSISSYLLMVSEIASNRDVSSDKVELSHITTFPA